MVRPGSAGDGPRSPLVDLDLPTLAKEGADVSRERVQLGVEAFLVLVLGGDDVVHHQERPAGRHQVDEGALRHGDRGLAQHRVLR